MCESIQNSVHAWSVAKSSCPTLCDPLDYSPPDSSVHGILQARILKWVAISSSRNLPDPGIKLLCPALAGRLFTTEPHLGSPFKIAPTCNKYRLTNPSPRGKANQGSCCFGIFHLPFVIPFRFLSHFPFQLTYLTDSILSCLFPFQNKM